MIEDMPSQEEQDIAEKYCCERVLIKPDTDIRKAAKCTAVFTTIVATVSLCAYFLIFWLGKSDSLPFNMNEFVVGKLLVTGIVITCAVLFISLIITRKIIVIGCVKLYQHYVDEDVRRRCLFKPTCSEYTILAVKKYGVIIGLGKSYFRLFKRCKGNIYRIDYP